MLSTIARYLVVLGYSYQPNNSANMTAIMATVTAITTMVRGRMEAVLLDTIVGQTALNYV